MTHNPFRAALAVVAAASALAWAVPAASEDFQDLYQLGQAARAAGEYDRAAELLSRALDMRPDDPDAYLLLGTTYAFQEDWARAEATLTRGLQHAPDYLALRLALARTHYWQDDYDRARAVLRPALAAAQPAPETLALGGRIALAAGRYARAERLLGRAASAEDPDPGLLIALGDARAELGDRAGARAAYRRARALSSDGERAAERLAALEGHPWRIDAATSYSRLNEGRDDWRALELTLSRDLTGAGTLSMTGRAEDRGFASDVRFGVSYTAIPREFARWRVSGALTPDADFLAKSRVGAGGDLRVYDAPGDSLAGTWLVADYLFADYSGTATHSFEPGLRQAFAGGRLSLEGRAIAINNSDGGWMSGWKVRGDARVADDLDLFAGAARAPETERKPGDDGFQTVDTLSLFVGMQVDLAPATRVLVALSRHDREESYERTQVSVSLTLRW